MPAGDIGSGSITPRKRTATACMEGIADGMGGRATDLIVIRDSFWHLLGSITGSRLDELPGRDHR
jgi:hypothetical protein